ALNARARCEHISASAPHINTRAKHINTIRYRNVASIIKMHTPTRSSHFISSRDTVFNIELREAVIAAFPFVHVQHDKAVAVNTDVGIRPRRPPLVDQCFVIGGAYLPADNKRRLLAAASDRKDFETLARRRKGNLT